MFNFLKKKEEKKVKLDLGCGKREAKGFIRIDMDSSVNPDYCLDLEKDPLPFTDSSVDFIEAISILEHIKNLDFLMNECYRVLKPEGRMHIRVPCYAHEYALSNPNHVRVFTEKTFLYYSTILLGEDGVPKKSNCDFHTESVQKIIDPEQTDKDKEVLDGKLNLNRYWNIFIAMEFILVAKKPKRIIVFDERNIAVGTRQEE